MGFWVEFVFAAAEFDDLLSVFVDVAPLLADDSGLLGAVVADLETNAPATFFAIGTDEGLPSRSRCLFRLVAESGARGGAVGLAEPTITGSNLPLDSVFAPVSGFTIARPSADFGRVELATFS